MRCKTEKNIYDIERMHTAKWERAGVSGGCFDGNGKASAKGIVRGSRN